MDQVRLAFVERSGFLSKLSRGKRGSTIVWFIVLFASAVTASISGSVPHIRMSSVPSKVRRQTLTSYFEADRKGAISGLAGHHEALQKLRARQPVRRLHTHSPFR